MTDNRDPIAAALEDLRKKEAAVERSELKIPEGMELILVDTVGMMPKWPPEDSSNFTTVFQDILDLQGVDFPRDIDNRVGSMKTLHPTEKEEGCRFALLKASQPLGVDIVRERAASFGTPVNIAGLVAIAGKLGLDAIGPEHILIGLGTLSREGFFPEISVEVVVSQHQRRKTLYVGHFHNLFRDDEPDDEKVTPNYWIPVIIPKNATILPS
jgi:hypothetical protein